MDGLFYDATYCHSAAYRKSLDWGIKDTDLHSKTFIGQAKVIAQCT